MRMPLFHPAELFPESIMEPMMRGDIVVPTPQQQWSQFIWMAL